MADQTSPIQQIQNATNVAARLNENFDAASPAMLYGRNAATTTGLTWGYIGGRFGSALIASGTVTLTASSTNHVVAARADGVVTSLAATTNWDDLTDYIRLYKVTAGASSVTGYEDHRQAIGGTGGGGAIVAADITDSTTVGRAVLTAANAAAARTAIGAGDVVGPSSSTDNTLPRFDGTTGKLLQGSGVAVTDSDEISGYKGNINTQTGTTYTLVAADSGKIVELSNATAIALTAAPGLPKGFNCTIVQGLAGVVTVASSGSGTVVNRQSQFKTAGANAMCMVYVRSNSGTNAVFVLGGDTAA